ncbi:hypothetical protein ACFL47_06215 [Candidatus Latescibacterota bacterium]
MNRRNALHIIGTSGVGAALPSSASAETMINGLRERWAVTKDYSMAMMDAMPAENFDFTP